MHSGRCQQEEIAKATGVVDEADRLKFQSLELLGDLYDRGSMKIGLILMSSRIFTEIERLPRLNCLPLITPDLIETARQGLLLGAA